jgi:hypothetical protein
VVQIADLAAEQGYIERRPEYVASVEVGGVRTAEPVFEAMLENAVRLCDAKFGNIYRVEGAGLHPVAMYNTPPAFAEETRQRPQVWRPGPKHPVGRMMTTKAVVHVADAASEDAYTKRLDPAVVAGVELGGVRTCIAVPMLKDDD